MTTITDGTEILHPILWMDYESTRDSNTIAHVLASGSTAITLRDSGPRHVNLALLFDDETESARCEAMHARKGIKTITEPDRDTHSMSYVVTGTISRELHKETAAIWIVSMPVMEIVQ